MKRKNNRLFSLLFASILSVNALAIPAYHVYAETDAGNETEIVDNENTGETESNESIQPEDDLSSILKYLDSHPEEITYSDSQDELSQFIASFTNLKLKDKVLGIEKFLIKADDLGQVSSDFDQLDFSLYTDEQLAPIVQLIHDIQNVNKSLPELSPSDLEIQDEMIKRDTGETSGFRSRAALYSASGFQKAQVRRISGQNRYLTAVQLSREGWISADTVILVSGEDFPDALAATPLAKIESAPILYARPNHLHPETLAEMKRLNAKKVIILGQTHAISQNIENQIKNSGIQVERIGGKNRYATAQLIGQYIQSKTKVTQAFLINGEAFADGVSIASYAANQAAPIYLTKSNQLPEEISNDLKSIPKWTLVGGNLVISDHVLNQVSAVSNSQADRINGRNRYATNQDIIRRFSFDNDEIYVASGENYPDALAASALAVRTNAPVLLVKNSELNNVVRFANEMNFYKFALVGGENVLSHRVYKSFIYVERNGKVFSIYLDAGHGGSEPGAQFYGYQEKNLNLSLAKKIFDYFRQDSRYDIYINRTTDKTISLKERTDEANRMDVDLFISVHHNAMGGANTGRARGIETFVQTLKYTSTPKYETDQPESYRVAEFVHPSVIASSGLYNRGIRGQNLHVNRESYMPSILVEYGFMDNWSELQVIKTPEYQDRVAKATKEGVDRYLETLGF